MCVLESQRNVQPSLGLVSFVLFLLCVCCVYSAPGRVSRQRLRHRPRPRLHRRLKMTFAQAPQLGEGNRLSLFTGRGMQSSASSQCVVQTSRPGAHPALAPCITAAAEISCGYLPLLKQYSLTLSINYSVTQPCPCYTPIDSNLATLHTARPLRHRSSPEQATANLQGACFASQGGATRSAV